MKKVFLSSLLFISFSVASLYAQQNQLTTKPTPDTPHTSPNPTSQENIKLVSNYFDYLFRTRDFVSMEKIISKDVIYSQAEGLPYGGTYIGFNGMVQMFTKAQGYFDLQIVGEPVYFTSSNHNEVIIHFTIKCKSKKSNNEITMPIAEYFELKNGMITGIRPFYFDTKTFADFLK